MTIWEQIIEAYPELANPGELGLMPNDIRVGNDSDGLGDYLEFWNYSKPIPDGLTLGKPTAQHNL